MGFFGLCTSSARTYSPRKSVTVYAEEGPGPLTRGTTKITESVQKVDEANVQLCHKCQQHLTPTTMSTLTSSHNATVQRLNTRVASANDALLKQQASHAEKDEALEQARLQIQQLQITNKGLKAKTHVLDIVSRELGARCEALGLEELPSVDLATWQSCVDTNGLPDHCISMCRMLLQQVKALDLARDIALEELSHLQQKVDVALEAHKKAEVARVQAEALAHARGEALNRANQQSRENEMEHDMLQRALGRALKELDMQREASAAAMIPSPLRLMHHGQYTPLTGSSPGNSPQQPHPRALLPPAGGMSVDTAQEGSAPLASLFGTSLDTNNTVSHASMAPPQQAPPQQAPTQQAPTQQAPMQPQQLQQQPTEQLPQKKIPVKVPPIKLDMLRLLKEEEEGGIGVALAPPPRVMRPVRASTKSSTHSYSYNSGTTGTQRTSHDSGMSREVRGARGRIAPPVQPNLPSFARDTMSSREKVVGTPSPRQYHNQLRARPAASRGPPSHRGSARSSAPTTTTVAPPPPKRPAPASVLEAKAARDALRASGGSIQPPPLSHRGPTMTMGPPNSYRAAQPTLGVVDRTVSDASSLGAGPQPVVQPPRAGHKSMMSKVERLLAGVWNSPDRTASRKTLKRAAPEAPQAAPLAAGRADVQIQPVMSSKLKASSPTMLPSPGYRRTYSNVRPAASRGRSAAHTTYLSTNELYVDRGSQ